MCSPLLVLPSGQHAPCLPVPGVAAAQPEGCTLAPANRSITASSCTASPLPLLYPQVDAAELEDARWFHADWLAAATGAEGAPPRAASRLGGHIPFRVPGRYALANRIIDSWLTERQVGTGEADERDRRTSFQSVHVSHSCPAPSPLPPGPLLPSYVPGSGSGSHSGGARGARGHRSGGAGGAARCARCGS
mgnify:CR=1 FL=1